MSSLLFAEVSATCNSLGYNDGSKYFIDPQSQESIRDLIRFLRRDDESHEIRRHLGEAKILQSDLLPLLKEYWKKTDLFDLLLRLLVNLTNPALLLYREELPAEKTSRNFYLQIVSHLQSYKEAFASYEVWSILCNKLSELLQIDWSERGEDQGLVIERILILVRNVLQVPSDVEAEKRPDNDANNHDQVLWTLHQAGMVDLFLYIACSENEQQYYMHILEIVSLMLREQNPTTLASAAASRSTAEKERDEIELLAFRQREIQQKHQKVKKYTGARFGGTYVLKNLKSISNEDLIYHKPLTSMNALEFDHEKTRIKRPKNRLPMKGGSLERRSALSIRLFLKEFCVEFLNGAYNTLMRQVKDGLVHAKAQANDESYYLWAMKFFMEFNRNYKFEMKLVSETMSVSAFHFVQTQLETFYEMMVSDKKKIHLWSRRIHLTLRAYQELLMTLIAMDKAPDTAVQESARVIKTNIFYVIEYRELILTLMLNFDEIKMSRAYLKDLVETTHIFLKLLEQHCRRSRGIIVQKQKHSRGRKKKTSNMPKPQPMPVRTAEERWDDVGPQVSALLQNEAVIPDVIPFNPASDVPIDDQKVDAVKKIQTYLREERFEESLGLLRASREVWPENDSFGSINPAPEEELLALRDIFLADLGQPFAEEGVTGENPNNPEEEDEEEDDEEEDQAGSVSVSEQSFQFMDFGKRFVHPKVVNACSLLMRQFETNSLYTNRCLLKLLHRIAWDCKTPAILFQASLFRTFQRVLESTMEQHKDVAKFAVFIIRKFIEVARTNSKVYMELLFWKTSRDAYEVENGYGSFQSQSHSAKQVWGEEEEEELRRLHQEFMGITEGVGEGDIVDWIMKNMINQDRSRRGVIKKLKELGYNVGAKVNRRPGVSRPSKEWSAEEEEQLTALFEEFRQANDPVGCILARLTVSRPKPRVVEKLLALGLVQDKKELHKKRAKKLHGKEGDSNSDTDSDGASSTGSTSPRHVHPAAKAQRPRKPNKPSKPKPRAKSAVHAYSSGKASQLLREVVAAGMSDALQWLSESLEETAADRETDFNVMDEGVPLLPILEDAVAAMDSPLFQRMLESLGMSPPADEQEVYWRIPAHLTSAELSTRKATVDQAVAGTSATVDDFDQDVANTCKKILEENASDLENDLTIDIENDRISKLSSSDSKGKVRNSKNSSKERSRVIPTLDSEDEDFGVSLNAYQDNEVADGETKLLTFDSSLVSEVDHYKESDVQKQRSKKRTNRRVMVNTSDSEEEITNENRQGMLNSDVEEDMPSSSKRRMVDSDCEDEMSNMKKSRKILLSDDDDD